MDQPALVRPRLLVQNSRHFFHRHPGAGMTRIKFVSFGADNVRFGTLEQISIRLVRVIARSRRRRSNLVLGSALGTRLLRCARNDLCMSSGSAWSKFGLVAFVLLAGVGQADSPNLAGQSPVAIYKQLNDFKTGARISAVMAPLVANLSDTDMRDLAAYYAYLPRPSDRPPVAGVRPRIVASGAPMRGIAPCGACHGGVDSKAGAGWLGGQPAVYLRTQLEAFSSGTRHNDIGEQMRNIARRLTAVEIGAASEFYADRP